MSKATAEQPEKHNDVVGRANEPIDLYPPHEESASKFSEGLLDGSLEGLAYVAERLGKSTLQIAAEVFVKALQQDDSGISFYRLTWSPGAGVYEYFERNTPTAKKAPRSSSSPSKAKARAPLPPGFEYGPDGYVRETFAR